MKPSHTSSVTILPPIWEQNYTVSRLLSIYIHDIIYELTEQISGEKYILKILDKKYFHKKLFQALSSSGCNFLLLPIEVTEDSQFIYFIYEYCPCLTDLLLVREFSYRELSILVQDIGNAILFLHENHIAHRDIAPGNIFMKENGRFLLGNFSSSLFEEKSFFSGSDIMTALSCKMRNLGCCRTGNTPSFSPPGCLNRKNGYYMDAYGFSMVLYLLLNESKPPAEEDFRKSSPSAPVANLEMGSPTTDITTILYQCRQQNMNSQTTIKKLLLTILTEPSTKELPDLQAFFYQLIDIFQNTAAENPAFHTTIIQQKNADFFLRTASLNNQQHHYRQESNKALAKNHNPSTLQSKRILTKNHMQQPDDRQQDSNPQNHNPSTTLQSKRVLNKDHMQQPDGRQQNSKQQNNNPSTLLSKRILNKDHMQQPSSRQQDNKQQNNVSSTLQNKKILTKNHMQQPDGRQQDSKQQNNNFSTLQSQKKLTKNHSQQPHPKKLPILLYTFLFISILLFSISLYRSLVSRQQKQTAVAQSFLSEKGKKIFLNRQNLTSVDFLQENHAVEILVLSENNIQSVKPLAELTQLLILDLSCNQQLTDILSLTALQNLQQLILTDTNITQEEYTALQNALPKCKILY